MASCQPSAAVGRGELLELGGDLGQRLLPALLATACRRRRSAAWWRCSPSAGFRARSVSKPSPMMNSVEPPPMSITRRCLPLRRLPVRDAEVDQARFLAAGRRLRCRGPARFPPAPGKLCGLRSWRTVLVAIARTRCGGMVAHALAEARQAVERARQRVGVQAALAVQAVGHAHGFAHAVDDAQLPEHVARDHHVETVGAEIDRGQQVTVLAAASGVGRRACVIRHSFCEQRAPAPRYGAGIA